MKVLIAGDYCDRYRVYKSIQKGDYSSILGDVKPSIEKADISIVNFEFPIGSESAAPIIKCGPHLNGQSKAIEALQYAHFNVCTLANNHILDQGAKCCIETRDLLEKSGFKTVGVGMNIEEAGQVLYLRKQDVNLAIINCCEHEFSIATEKSAGANPLNPIQQYYAIQEAKRKADYILVIVHGGHEHFQLPSPRMQETYRFFIDAGADAVVNHHQHCYSGHEYYNGKPIYYGIGNFLFDHNALRNNIWNEGYMVVIDFEKNHISSEVIPYHQCNSRPAVELMKDTATFTDSFNRLSKIIQDETLLRDEYEKWLNKTQSGYRILFEPYSSKFTRKLFKLGLLPSFLNEKKIVKLIDFINCESHLDRIKYLLNKQLNNDRQRKI